MVNESDYAMLVDFMRKSLFQSAAPTFEEAIGFWKLNSDAAVRTVIAEIDRLLAAGYSEEELAQFLDRHSDYELDDGPIATLQFIRSTLAAKS
jgi:hypothetical protein